MAHKSQETGKHIPGAYLRMQKRRSRYPRSWNLVMPGAVARWVWAWLCLGMCMVWLGSAADAASGPSIQERYFQAEACYKALGSRPKNNAQRNHWLRCIGRFQEVQKADPGGPWAAAGLYMSGKLWEELARISKASGDRNEALDAYLRVVKRYPKSSYRSRAQAALQRMSAAAAVTAGSPKKPPSLKKPWRSLKAISRKKKRQKSQDRAAAKKSNTVKKPSAVKSQKTSSASAQAPTAPGGRSVTITGLRYWSNPNYSRVVIDADGPVEFNHRLLKKDPTINKPQRLFVDLAHSRLKKGFQKMIPIHDNLLIDARAGQYSADQVRVVVDIKTIEDHKVFALKNPFRIVIDIRGAGGGSPKAAGPTDTAMAIPPPAGRSDIGDLAKQLALGVARIVIDPGHGGRDYGAPGYIKGVHEKKVTLAVAKKLARKIRKEIGCEAMLTRTDDRFLTLEERTAKANTLGADLFISLHTNAARDSSAHGLETYFLNFATDNEAVLVAARENATSTNNISDLQSILSELMRNAKINESRKLATYVQKTTYNHLRKTYSRTKNKGVKQAPFYVLLGAQMPSILVETAFISNPRECKRLMNAKYQDKLCEGIVKGIVRYINETTPMARGNVDKQSKVLHTKGG